MKLTTLIFARTFDTTVKVEKIKTGFEVTTQGDPKNPVKGLNRGDGCVRPFDGRTR